MNPADASEQTIFDAARQLPDHQARAAYLDAACAGNPSLRERIEKLLKAGLRADQFLAGDPLELRAATTQTVAPLSQGPGTVIGKYKLLEKLGEGGFGVVYMAEQKQPVKRRLALKIIKVGMDTREVVARFEAERQALALMEHPNIAKVFDAGATDTGRPYFVMELVRGIKITDYCDEKNLSTKDRLDLFSQVCQAVQHAHQKGIIHRDLKPSNILVTLNDGAAVPKIIDFGIAKATQMELTDKTVFTRFQQFLGTPAYMSPEQAEISSVDIDTRSDIYSLGVLLYELLTGKTPFDSKELFQAGLDEMRRTIREQEPQRPSTRVSTLGADELTTTAKRRGLEAPKLVNVLRGDLDWIVMKCLEKDRARRYETANGLARDIQRHLTNEPVLACPPSRLYRFQKLIRRNKVGFIATAAVTLSLLLGTGFSTWMYYQELRLRRAAKKEAAKSQEVSQLLEQMLQGVGPSKALGRDTTMLREILDQTAERLSKELTNQPEVEIEIRLVLARTYHDLGLYKELEAMARESLRLARRLPAGNERLIARSLHWLGEAFMHLGELPQAEDTFRQAVELEKSLPDGKSMLADSLTLLANVLHFRGNLSEGEQMEREVIAMREKMPGAGDLDLATCIDNLAVTSLRRGRLAEAEAGARQALAMRRKLLPAEHPDVAVSLNNVASILVERGKLAEAEETARQALAMTRRLFPAEHPAVARSLGCLAEVLAARGKQAEAESLYRQQLQIRRKLLGNEHPDVAHSLHLLSNILEEQAKWPEAERTIREALAIRQKAFGTNHVDTGGTLDSLGFVLFREDKLAEAETNLNQALEIERNVLGREHPDVARTIDKLGSIKLRQGKYSEAELFYSDALAICIKAYGEGHYQVADILNNLAIAVESQGRVSEAEAIYRKSLGIDRKARGNEHPKLATDLHNLARNLFRQRELPEAEAAARESFEMDQKLLREGHPDRTDALDLLTGILLSEGKLSEAEPLFQMQIETYRKSAEAGDVDAMNSLAWVLATCIRPQVRDGSNALTFAQKAVAATKRGNPQYLDTLAAAYAEAGEFTKATSAQEEAIALLKDENTKRDFESRLKLYQSNRPYHEQ